MKVAVIGANATGLLFGGWLAGGGHRVTVIDFAPDVPEVVPAVEESGIWLVGRDGVVREVPARATSEPATVGTVDLLVVCVQYFQTVAAIEAARPLLGAGTAVLSLQPGWGDAERIAERVGAGRALLGVTGQRGALLGANTVRHEDEGRTAIGRLSGGAGGEVARVVEALNAAGVAAEASGDIAGEAWRRLAIDAPTLPVCALLGFAAGDLIEHAGSLDLTRALLREVVAVAGARGVALDEDERWRALRGLLEGALETGSGILQEMREDVAARRRSDVDAINGAVAAEGRRLGVPTPHNDTMLWMVRSLEQRDDGVQ